MRCALSVSKDLSFPFSSPSQHYLYFFFSFGSRNKDRCLCFFFVRTEVILFKSFTVLWVWSLVFAFSANRVKTIDKKKYSTVKLKRRETDRHALMKSALLSPTPSYVRASYVDDYGAHHVMNYANGIVISGNEFNERYTNSKTQNTHWKT